MPPPHRRLRTRPRRPLALAVLYTHTAVRLYYPLARVCASPLCLVVVCVRVMYVFAVASSLPFRTIITGTPRTSKSVL